MRDQETFALLISIYGGDRAEFLNEAFRSAVHDQSRRPDQVVVVRDGPIPDELSGVLRELVESSPSPVTLVELEHNVGLGPALDSGLAACEHDIVARMDADDVALPHRFATQVPLVEAGNDIVGSALFEFGTDPTDIVGRRTPPTDPEAIARYARFHDPFNHPTVVYRASAVAAAGGYEDLSLMEDYLLFARMIGNGARVANIAEPLVYYRVGSGAYGRRGGLDLLRSELALQRRFREQEFTSRLQYFRNVLVRAGYRLLPEWLRRLAYRRVIATYGERRSQSRERGQPDASLPGRQDGDDGTSAEVRQSHPEGVHER